MQEYAGMYFKNVSQACSMAIRARVRLQYTL